MHVNSLEIKIGELEMVLRQKEGELQAVEKENEENERRVGEMEIMLTEMRS